MSLFEEQKMELTARSERLQLEWIQCATLGNGYLTSVPMSKVIAVKAGIVETKNGTSIFARIRIMDGSEYEVELDEMKRLIALRVLPPYLLQFAGAK